MPQFRIVERRAGSALFIACYGLMNFATSLMAAHAIVSAAQSWIVLLWVATAATGVRQEWIGQR